MLFYRNESSLDEMLFQCFLADKSANQAAHQSSSNNDYQHGNRSDIEHSLNVLRGNIVFLHCANKRTLKKFDGADSTKSKNSTEQRIRHHHGLHRDFLAAHNQEVTDDTANHQTDGDEPESAHQQEQNGLNGGTDGKYPFLWHFGQQKHHHDTIRNSNNGRVKHIGHRASHAHNGADNHANNPHEGR